MPVQVQKIKEVILNIPVHMHVCISGILILGKLEK